jgi:hypothetical protein
LIWIWSWDPLKLCDVIRRTTSAPPRQNPAGQDPKRAFATSKSRQQRSDQTRKPVKSEQHNCSFDSNHGLRIAFPPGRSLASRSEPAGRAFSSVGRSAAFSSVVASYSSCSMSRADFKPLLMKARPGACAGRKLSKIEISRPNRLRPPTPRLRRCDVNALRGTPWPRQPHACLWPAGPPNHVAANAAATAGAHRATAVGFVSVFSRLPVHRPFVQSHSVRFLNRDMPQKGMLSSELAAGI